MKTASFKMKFLFIFLFLNVSIFAQTQDLFSLATGDYLYFNPLFDEDDNLYGYVAIYGYGKSGDKTKKFEYVILDKNLNPVANKEFEGDITAELYAGYIDFRKKLILYPKTDHTSVSRKEFFYPRSMEVDLASNTISTKMYYEYENDAFVEVTEPKNVRDERKEDKSEKKEKGYNYVSNVYEIKEGGFIVFEYDDYGKYTNNHGLMRFDESKNLLWNFKYNEEGDKKNSESIQVIDKDDNYIYTMLMKKEKDDKTFFLQVIDMKTGEIVITKSLEGSSTETIERINYVYTDYYRSVDNDKSFDDKIIIVGRNYNSYSSNGFTRMIIDKQTLNVELKTLYYSDLKDYLPEIKKNGYLNKGYKLDLRDFFFLQDGSVGILMEKFKPAADFSAPKTTDLVYVYTDKDFVIKGVKVFEKQKTKWAVNTDYLFSQYLNDGKDVVFFYRDLQKDAETKEKNWNLFINTLIDGNFNQEQIQISEKDNYIVIPYVGKEGYILLREFNKKDKFNKIRLERLNY
jgi:hypothetical protein